MWYGPAADALVVLHAAFVVFVVLGGLIVQRWPRVAWFHVPAALWGAAVELSGWICPLTPMEIGLRRQAGQLGYSGGFIDNYLLPALYPEGLNREAQVVLGLLVVALNAALYWRLSLGSRGRDRSSSQSSRS